MNLEQYQRALLSLSFAEAPDQAGLEGFALYRSLVRSRLFAMAQVAYRRSWKCLGEAACDASFARFLAAEPPRSPLIREVIGAFAAFAEQDGGLWRAGPACARSLLRFEAAKWRVASAVEAELDRAVSEVDFDGVLVLNPTLELVTLEYEVADAAQAELPDRGDPHTLFVYRRPGEDEVRWYRAPGLLSELLARAQLAESCLGELLPRVLEERRQRADEQLVEELAAGLAVAVERGVLLGVRPAGP